MEGFGCMTLDSSGCGCVASAVTEQSCGDIQKEMEDRATGHDLWIKAGAMLFFSFCPLVFFSVCSTCQALKNAACSDNLSFSFPSSQGRE